MKKLILLFLVAFSNYSFSQTWVQKLNGISMWSLEKNIQGHIFAGTSGTVKSIYKSTDGGESWNEVLFGSPSNFLYISCDSSGGVYAANVSNGVMKSTNYGLNWTNIPSSTFGNNNVNSVKCGKNGYIYAGVTSAGIYVSTDNGNTFTNTALTGFTIVSLQVDRFNSNIIYAGASSASQGGFFRSTDAGFNFSANLNPFNIYGIVQKPNGNIYTVSTSTGYPFDKSTNGGLNWTTMFNHSGAMRGECLDPSGTVIYTSGNGGVWKSTNDGVNFTNYNFTYSSNQILFWYWKVLVAVLGTSNGGVWIYNDSSYLSVENKNNLPMNFELYQNYPNPFNPVTIIMYDIPKTSKVKLVIYDILGREVITLINNEFKEAGRYIAEFNASNFASGVYFYRIEMGDYKMCKKLVLLK